MDNPEEVKIWRVEIGAVIGIALGLVVTPLVWLYIDFYSGTRLTIKWLWMFLAFEVPWGLFTLIMCEWRSRRLLITARGLQMKTMMTSLEMDWEEITVVRISAATEGTRFVLHGAGGTMSFLSMEGTERLMRCFDERSKGAMILDYTTGTFLAPEKDGPGGRDETRLAMIRSLNRGAVLSGLSMVWLVILGLAFCVFSIVGLWTGNLGCHHVLAIPTGLGLALFSLTRKKEGSAARAAARRLQAGEEIPRRGGGNSN